MCTDDLPLACSCDDYGFRLVFCHKVSPRKRMKSSLGRIDGQCQVASLGDLTHMVLQCVCVLVTCCVYICNDVAVSISSTDEFDSDSVCCCTSTEVQQTVSDCPTGLTHKMTQREK